MVSDGVWYPDEKKLKCYGFSDLAKLDQRRNITPWAVDDWYSKGTVTMLHGPGASGKSTVVGGIALSAASGKNLFPSLTYAHDDYDENKNPYGECSLWCCGEDDPRLIRDRLRAQWVACGYSIEDELFKERLEYIFTFHRRYDLVVRDEYGHWEASEFLELLEYACDQSGCTTIFIDPLNAYKGALNLSNTDDATAFMNIMTQWAGRTHLAVVLVHHETKPKVNAYGKSQGGQHADAPPLFDRARSVIQVEATGRGMRVIHRKNNYGPQYPQKPPVEFERVGEAILEIVPQDDVENIIENALEWLKDHSKATPTIGGIRAGVGNDAKELIAHIREKACGLSNGEIAAALQAGIDEGKICEREVTGKNGRTKNTITTPKTTVPPTTTD